MIRILIIIIILSALAAGLIITIASTIDIPRNESPISQSVKKPTFTLELLSPSPLPVGRITDNATLVLDGATAVHTTTIGSSTYAIVASILDRGIQIINITNPKTPIPVSSVIDNTKLVLSSPTAVHTTTIGPSTYAIVTSDSDHGIQIINITNPKTPIPVSSVIDYTTLVLEGPYDVHTTTIDSSTYAIVASTEDNGIQIINITNPKTPIPVSSVIDHATLELEGPIAVHTTTIGSSTYAIVASTEDNGIQIINITNPKTPIPVSSLTDDSVLVLDNTTDIHTTTIGSNTYAIVASNFDNGIQIIDITNPVTPIPVSSLTDHTTLVLDGAEAVHTTTIGSSTYAIVTSFIDNGIQIINITNPKTPIPVSSLTDDSVLELEGPVAVHTTTIGSNTYAIVASFRDDGIEIIQLTQTIPINNSPTSIDDYTTLSKNQITVINVLENDSDGDDDPLEIVLVNNTDTLGHAAIVKIQNNTVNDTITFTPLANFEGNTTFTYTVSDGYSNSTSSVYVTVSPQKDEDVDQSTSISSSNTPIELDQSVYSWTDKVHITVTAPSYNLNSSTIDEIGDTIYNPIKVSTKDHTLDQYKLVETGVDTGIFTGHVTLTGFGHDTDGNSLTGDSNGFDTNPRTGDFNGQNSVGLGPTNGFLKTNHNDLITISFELSENKTMIGTAPIRWNFGTIEWLESIYPGTRTGIVKVIDPDMNLDPEYPDDFDVVVLSDSDLGGLDLTVTETGNATGIFEGTVYFGIIEYRGGHILRVSDGDTITAKYSDHTLPYHQSPFAELNLKDTALFGMAPPLERTLADDLGIKDSFDNPINNVTGSKYAPVSVDDYITISKNQITVINVLENDSDGDGDTLKIVSVNSTSTLGEIAIVKTQGDTINDSITFAPLDNFEGNTTFTYTVSDGYNSSTSFVYVMVLSEKDKNVNQPMSTSNSDAIIKLDQKVYSWTDSVHITIVAPSHNLNSNIIDEIGDSLYNSIKVSTKNHALDRYKLVETGVDTGIFTGQVLLTGFEYNIDPKNSHGKSNGYNTNPRTGDFRGHNSVGLGPTNGYLETSHNDIVTVSFELSENKTMISSAPIQWTISTIEWSKSIYPSTGIGVLRIVDPDMDLNPKYANEFDVAVWSDTDSDGIDLTMTETGDATGVFLSDSDLGGH